MSIEEFRKAQESLGDLLGGGYWKQAVELQKQMFDEYIKAGFTREESLKLTMAMSGLSRQKENDNG